MNFKTNKRKFVAKIMLLVLLVTSAFSFTGCGEKYKYKFLASYDFGTIIAATAYSDTNVFDIDNVTLTLSYGAHELDFLGRADDNPKEQLPITSQNNQLALYIWLCNKTSYKEKEENSNCGTIIRIVEEEEIFSQEYGYIDTPFFISNGIIYKHNETITIPSYMFENEYGTVYIRFSFLVAKKTPVFIDGKICSFYAEVYIPIKYKKIENDKVELINYDK